MKRFRPILCPLALLVLLSAWPLLAQTRTQPPTSTASQGTTGAASTTPGGRRGGQQPCWQQVGISQSAVQQRKQIEANSRNQMESVCSDSSLSAQQKQQKIHQLREQVRSQLQALVNPQQEQALRSCRQQRGEGRGEGGARGGKGGHGGESPCGERAGGGHGARPFQSESESEQQ
jgi:hypothetical protein